MVSVTEIKRLYSILLSNTHILIHNITSLPADFFFFNPQIDGSGKKKWSATDRPKEKKKKWEWVEQRGENQPGQNGIDEEKAPAEKIYETVCAVGKRGKPERSGGGIGGDGIGGRKKEDQRKRKANSLYVKQKISEIYQSSVGEMWLVKPWQMSIWWKMIF